MKYLTLNKYWKLNKEYNIDKLLYVLIDRSTVIDDNYLLWLNDKELYHRNYDLPADIDLEDKSVEWYQNNEIYREDVDKPVIILEDGQTI